MLVSMHGYVCVCLDGFICVFIYLFHSDTLSVLHHRVLSGDRVGFIHLPDRHLNLQGGVEYNMYQLCKYILWACAYMYVFVCLYERDRGL